MIFRTQEEAEMWSRFAAAALASRVARSPLTEYEVVADVAAKDADAMLTEFKKRNP
jgi:hypothetical protein